MKLEDFKVVPGQLLQVQLADDVNGPKASASVIGLVRDKALLISPPRGRIKLRNGQKLTVRLTLGDGFVLFNCALVAVVTAPVPVCFLSYPERVTHKKIRASQRIEVKLPVRLVNHGAIQESSAEGSLTDLSTTGARLELTEALVEVGHELTLQLQLGIDNVQRDLTIHAVVRAWVERSTREIEEQRAVFGLEFLNNSEDVQLALSAYVYRQMALGVLA